MASTAVQEAVHDATGLLLFSSPSYFLVLALLLLLVTVVLFSSWSNAKVARGYGGRKVPPGSLGLPLGIGETLQFAFSNTCPIGTPPPFLFSRFRKFGTVFTTHLIGSPTVVSMDHDLNKLLLSNEEKLVQVNFPVWIRKIVGPMLTVHGECHQRWRGLGLSIFSPATIPTFHFAHLQEHARSSLRQWSYMRIVDAQQEFRKFVFTYMTARFLSLAPNDPITEQLMRNYLFLMDGYAVVPLDLPGTTYNKVLKARKTVFNTINGLVQDRIKSIRLDIKDRSAEPKDLVDVLLKEMHQCDNHFNEDKEIVEIIFVLLLASFETSSMFLTNLMKFLSENADVVEELRKEHAIIRRNKKADEPLVWDDLKLMDFTQYVVKETLRIASIVHFVTREALQDIVFRDMVIPKGWPILINFSMVHLNPSNYKDPLKFNPWRWKDTKSNNQAFFMPFGGGIRSCVGAYFAKLEASVFIHYLVTNYKWERVKNGEQLDVVSSYTFPIMKNGLPIKLELL